MTHASRAPGRVQQVCLNVACGIGVVVIVWFLLSVLLGWSLVLFKTGSMAPTYPTGAAGISVPVTADQIETGDVVTVPRAEGGLPVTHRVVSVEDPGAGDGSRELVLQGDDNPNPDREVYTVTEADKVVVGAPYVGYAVTVLAQPKTLAILTAAMAALTVWVFWPRTGDDETNDEVDDEDGEAGPETQVAAGPVEGGTSDDRAATSGGEKVLVSTAADHRPTRATLREQERQRHGRRPGPGRESPP